MLKDILDFRRAIRYYAPTPVSEEKVRECLKLATLAPTTYNIQLYEVYHITDKELLKRLGYACLDQQTATTAQQMVVFVARQDEHRLYAKEVLKFERGNIQRNSPPEKQAERIKEQEKFYNQLTPFLPSRCFGLSGFLCKALGVISSWFHPMMQLVSENDMRVNVHKSCGLVTQTFMLAMAEAGYNTCPIGGFDSRRAKRILHLPYGAEVSILVSCGLREDQGVRGERFRLPFEGIYKKK